MAYPIIVIKENRPKLLIQVLYGGTKKRPRVVAELRLPSIEPRIGKSELHLRGNKVGRPANGKYELALKPRLVPRAKKAMKRKK
jgi:hypothetical protein